LSGSGREELSASEAPQLARGARQAAALVLAAGEGRRLRPLTGTLPKALCPVGNVALIDRALARLTRYGFTGPSAVAVNVCYLADQVAEHVGGRAFISREPGPPALGTSGAVAHLRDWVAGRPLLVGNSDAYLSPDAPDAPGQERAPAIAPVPPSWCRGDPLSRCGRS